MENRLEWGTAGGWEKDYRICGNLPGRDGGSPNEGGGENRKEYMDSKNVTGKKNQ